MGKTRSWTAGSVALVLLAGVACQSEEAPPIETSAGSQVTAVVVDQRADVGTFDGVPFERLIGRPEGRVHRSEAVAGLAELLGAAPFHTYRSQFEVIQPVSASDRLARDPDPPRRTRRYELPAPKVPPAVFGDTFVFGMLGCNDRQAVPLNPLDLRPYLRALLVGLESELGRSDRRLPPSMLFDLGPEPAPSPYFNDLPGAEVAVPSLDGDGQPQGGVRFPELDLPLGRPEPPAIPPVATTTNVCGNWGGYRPFPATELQRRYGGVVEYERRVEPLIDRLVQRGLLLRADRQWVVEDLRSRFAAAPSDQPKN
jgi:hypothetical protein